MGQLSVPAKAIKSRENPKKQLLIYMRWKEID